MPGQELALVPPPSASISTFEVMDNAWTLAQQIARTEFVPAALRGKPEAVMAAVLTGHEVGLPPMASLGKIHVIEGKPTLSAEAMRALVLSRGHELWFEEISNARATICGVRAGSTRETRVTWTMDDAKKAGLEGKQNWRKFPRAMLEARATGELCRLIFADVLGGISYTVEELDDGILDGQADAADVETSGAEVKPITRKAAPAKRTAAKKTAAKPAAAGSAPPTPPLPPLPGEDDALPSQSGSGGPPPEDPAVVTKRAQAIAIRARELDVDHHQVVAIVTCGRTSSAKVVDADEGADVLEALRQIKLGEKHLADGDDGPVLADGPAPPGPSLEEQLEESLEAAGGDVDQADDDDVVDGEIVDGDEADWDSNRWRAYLAERGVKVTEVIREGQRLAGQMGEKAPANLEDLHGRRSLCSLLRGFVEDLAEQRGMT